MNISTFGIPKAGLPDGFVYIDELIEDCIIDAKYAGTDNFMGRPAAGYEQPLVVMSRQLADCCVKAALPTIPLARHTQCRPCSKKDLC